MRAKCSFAEIKDSAGAAGLPIQRLTSLQQSGGATKGELFDAVIRLVSELSPEGQDRATRAFLAACVQASPAVRAELEPVLAQVGWRLTENGPVSLDLHLQEDARQLPQQIMEMLDLATRRFAQGDTSGAITSICGAVDRQTADLYDSAPLGDHASASYQERVSKAFGALEEGYLQPLCVAGLEQDEAKRVWENHRKAVSQAAYVLGSYRRQFSDVHGKAQPPQPFAQAALDCAVFILRSFTRCA